MACPRRQAKLSGRAPLLQTAARHAHGHMFTWWRRDARTCCQAVPLVRPRRHAGVSKRKREQRASKPKPRASKPSAQAAGATALTIWTALAESSAGAATLRPTGANAELLPTGQRPAEERPSGPAAGAVEEEIEEICTPSVAADMRRERRAQGLDVGDEEEEGEEEEGEEEEDESFSYSAESYSGESGASDDEEGGFSFFGW